MTDEIQAGDLVRVRAASGGMWHGKIGLVTFVVPSLIGVRYHVFVFGVKYPVAVTHWSLANIEKVA